MRACGGAFFSYPQKSYGEYTTLSKCLLVRVGGLVQVLARAIVGQQVSSAAARTVWGRLQAAAERKQKNLPEFFCPKNLRTMRRCGLSKNKARFLIALAQEASALSRMPLARLPHLERTAILERLPGVGPWTCDMVGIFYCRDLDIWPAGDLALQRAFVAFTGLPQEKIPDAVVPFAPYRSLLALSLWKLKKNLPQ